MARVAQTRASAANWGLPAPPDFVLVRSIISSCAPWPAQPADGFVRLVPRDRDALPPAVILDMDENCPRKPTRALLLTELSTFLNQVETHMGKAAIIAPDAEFEAEYRVSQAINRPLWLRSNRAEPPAEGPAWIIWQANDALKVAGSTGPTRWLVLNEGRHVAGDAGEGE